MARTPTPTPSPEDSTAPALPPLPPVEEVPRAPVKLLFPVDHDRVYHPAGEVLHLTPVTAEALIAAGAAVPLADLPLPLPLPPA